MSENKCLILNRIIGDRQQELKTINYVQTNNKSYVELFVFDKNI